MAQLNKLSARFAETAKEPGRYSDGGNLYLVVESGGSKRWAFIYRWKVPGTAGAGKLREMGLGSYATVTLARAREKASKARELIDRGIDPIAAKKAERDIPTFGDFADAVVDDLTPQWRNPKHAAQWKSTLKNDAAAIRALAVDAITTDHVLKVLKPIWMEKPETASRLRGRIERVLDAARAKGYRSGENPARWRGHLDNLLPKRQTLSRGHHAAMPYEDVPEFMMALRKRDGFAARALEFAILTAARSGEVLGAKWQEIDLASKVWTVPANRMKTGKEHRVALSDAAIKLLKAVAEVRCNDFIFPGNGRAGGLSVMAMEMLLRRMKAEVTVHGFRSSFRDWVGEETSFPSDVAEAALSHRVGNAVERAYRRRDSLDKRVKMMEAWSSYCDAKPAAKLVSLKRTA